MTVLNNSNLSKAIIFAFETNPKALRRKFRTQGKKKLPAEIRELSSTSGFKETEYIIQNELPRMEIVIKNLIIYKWIEISLMLLGVFLYFCFRYSTQKFWKGLGLGLLIQALIMLSLDFVAERRSVTYLNKLKMVTVLL